MHSRRRYKICVCLVILQGNLWLFQITSQDFNVLFPKILDAIERFTKRGNVSYSSLHHIFESENFSFPFSKKISLTLGVKYEK